MERRGLHKRRSSFGSIVKNVPPPVLTGGREQPSGKIARLEQPSLNHIPNPRGGVSNVDSSQAAARTTVGSSFGSTASSVPFGPRSSVSEQFDRSSIGQVANYATIDDILGANPYLRRADEIGLRHQVPGVGHLGNYLVPPGWKEGDLPINPDAAKQLYDLDRQAAVHDLDMSLADQRYLTNEEKEQLAANINYQWRAQLLLDQTVLSERLLVHRQHQEQRLKKIERWHEKGQDSLRNRPSEVSRPVQPQVMNSLRPSPLPESPSGRSISNFQNQMDPRIPQSRLHVIT